MSADGIVVPDADALEGKGERFASLPSNLPEPASPLIGRPARTLPRSSSWPGNIGSSRSPVPAGSARPGSLDRARPPLAPEFLDGVAFVALADVTDAAQFLPALADALDVKEAEGRTLGDGVVALIGDKKALLLLDNLEQIVAAAPEVAELVERCPGLRIVTTSRTPLRIAAEREYPLAPLGRPSSSDSGVDRVAHGLSGRRPLRRARAGRREARSS